MVNKKGQVKIQQMAFMLIAVTLFFVLVGLLALSFIFKDLNQSKEELDKQNAISLVSTLADSPEFSCTNSFGTQKTNCVDFDKVFALKYKIEKFKFLWDVQGIEIIKIGKSDPVICTPKNYPNCDHLEIYNANSQGIDFSTFVTLCHKEKYETKSYDKCEIALLIVRLADE